MLSTTVSNSREIASKIMTSLETDTKYMFYEGVDYRPTDHTGFISKNDFEFKVVKGTYFTLQDAFILNGIHTLGYATVDTLLTWLSYQRKLFPKKAIPDFQRKQLHSRMIFLTKQGILAEYDYVTKKKIVVHVFVCPAYGHLYFRNLLDLYSSYDQSALFRTEVEIFKRLAANEVSLSFVKYKYLKQLQINWRSTDSSNNGLGYIYGLAQMVKDENTKENFLIEPVYFSVDPKIMTEEENCEKINNRLDKVIEIVEKLSEEAPTRIIFCIENLTGLKKFVNLIKTRDLDIFHKALYTSENVLCRTKWDLKRSFLRIEVAEGKIKFSPHINDWAFED